MGLDVVVAGVGVAKFAKPGTSETYAVMGETAARLALQDAGLSYSDVAQVYAGYVYGGSTSGQAAVYGLGLTGVPIINVNNNCATGSTALFLARQLVESGAAECVLALGFEQMTPGPLSDPFTDRPSPMERQTGEMDAIIGQGAEPIAARYFGGAGAEYIEKYGAKPETFGKVSEKARRHAAHNPLALFRSPLSLDEIMASPRIFGPMTRLQCCPPTCGAAAAVVCSGGFAKRRGVTAPIKIVAQSMKTDFPSTLEERSMIKLVGFDMAKAAAADVYECAGVGPGDVDVVELHDCFTANEILAYEALGLAPLGEAEKFVWDGENTYGGKVVTNPSGGLLSKGHPLGATGLAQCAELVWQLRGQAEQRQVEGANIALQHNLGLGGACVVTLYQK